MDGDENQHDLKTVWESNLLVLLRKEQTEKNEVFMG